MPEPVREALGVDESEALLVPVALAEGEMDGVVVEDSLGESVGEPEGVSDDELVRVGVTDDSDAMRRPANVSAASTSSRSSQLLLACLTPLTSSGLGTTCVTAWGGREGGRGG